VKYAELELKHKEKEFVIKEMGRMMKDQQCLILRIFKELNSLKEKDGSYPAMSERELISLTNAAKYPLMHAGAGAESEEKAGEDLFDEDMGIDFDAFTGPEVVGGSKVNYTLVDEPMEDVNVGSEEEVDIDNEDEPEAYNVEDRDVTYQYEHINLDKS